MATIDVMISEEEIANKVKELAKQIEKDYEGEQLLVVGILKGASVFVSDLIRKIDLDVNIDFMSVSSYGNGTESSGTVRILKDLDVDIAGKNVLIVEDIIDSGLTLSNLVKELKIRRTNLSTIQDIKFPKNIEEIELDDNQLTNIDNVNFGNQLTYIDLQNNQIEDISKVKFPNTLEDFIIGAAPTLYGMFLTCSNKLAWLNLLSLIFDSISGLAKI